MKRIPFRRCKFQEILVPNATDLNIISAHNAKPFFHILKQHFNWNPSNFDVQLFAKHVHTSWEHKLVAN